ncbi:MAG: hypothetical protein PHV59_04640 [Victivallales bacterium]|nr:hypothetical protein [Victivallales bacterium]
MNLNAILNIWDIILLLVVAIESTVLAYICHPKWKAFMLILPFPFTVAVFAVGKPVNATNMSGLILLLLFSHCVRILHNNFKINIFTAIIVSVFVYCFSGFGLNRFLPENALSFWISTALVFLIAGLNIIVQPHRDETGHKSSMPVWFKLIVIFAIVFFLILLKKNLSGFITVFPMVGVIAAYEARKSLWTISRQIPFVMLSLGPMIAAIYIFQNLTGLCYAVIIGWIVFLAIVIPQFIKLKKHTAACGLAKAKNCSG